MPGLILGIAVLVGILVAVAYAMRTPRGSGGAPGEVVADEPLTHPTGTSVDDRSDPAPAEDRPGGPDQEPMDPELIDGDHSPPARG